MGDNTQDKILELLEKIDKKFSYLIGTKIQEKDNPIGETVLNLSNKGFENSEIAKIMGTTSKKVADNLYVMRKKKK